MVSAQKIARSSLPARSLQAAVLYLLLIWLGILSLTYNLVAFLLYPLLSEQRGRQVGRAGIAYGYRLFWYFSQVLGLMRIDNSALDVLNDDPGGLIIASNHPSMADALLLCARLPRSVCIMKASLVDNIFLGAGARLARYIGNASPRQMIRASVEALRQGGHLVIFPEGTRTPPPVGAQRRQLNPFRPGLTLIAYKANVPIQTVIIETDSPYLGKGWPIWRPPPIPVVFRLRLGDRFEPEADHAAMLARLEDYFRREVNA